QGEPVTLKVSDILDTTAPLLDYAYEDTSDPLKASVPLEAVTLKASMTTPDLAGATLNPSTLSAKVVHIAVPTEVTPHAFRMAKAATPEHVAAFAPTTPPSKLVDQVTLQLEHVMSTSTSATYDVYLSVPAGADPTQHEDRFVGRMAMFGIGKASAAAGP